MIRRFDVLDNPIPEPGVPYRSARSCTQTSPKPAVNGSSHHSPRATRCRRWQAGSSRCVTVKSRDYALLVPSLTALPVTDLRHVIANLADDRERIMAALDYLFMGA